MAITPLPSLDRTSATFKTEVDTFFANNLPTFSVEANAAAVAMNLNSTNDTSSSSVAIGDGSKTFTVTAGKSFLKGMYLVIADTADPSTNSMYGQVTSYSGTTLIIYIFASKGSGTKTAWTISQSAPGASSSSNKNDIINGNFRIAQIGASFPAAASGAYYLDGWLFYNTTSTGVFTLIQAPGSSTGTYRMQITTTTADTSIAAGEFVLYQTRIRGYDSVKYIGNTFVLGFEVKSSIAGVYCVSIGDGANRYIAEYTIDVIDTPQYIEIIVQGGLTALSNTTTGIGIAIVWAIACGSTYQNTAGTWHAGTYYATSNQVNGASVNGNVFSLQNVTLNLGVVPVIDDKSELDDLIECKQYYREVQVQKRFDAPTVSKNHYDMYSFEEMASTPTATLNTAGTLSNMTSVDLQPTSSNQALLVCVNTAAGDSYVTGRFYGLSSRL